MPRRSTDREPPGDLDLIALDPVTGASLDPDAATAANGDDDGPISDAELAADRRTVRARRLHRLAATLAGAAVAAAVMAGWFGLSIRHLREVEHTWRAALAVDQSRESADRTIHLLVPGDSEAIRQPLDDVGDEEANRLLATERALDHQRILDPKVSKLRDEMIAALRFRRFQMTPERLQLGRTPIDRAEALLDDQLDRWGLHPTYVQPPRLRTLDDALEGLRRYSTLPTRTTLAALTTDGRVVEVDVDKSTTGQLATDADADAQTLAAVPGGGLAVSKGNELAILDANGKPASTVDLAGGFVVPGGATSDGVVLWITHLSRSDVRRVVVQSPSAVTVGDAVALPPGRTVVGANRDSLVLTPNDRGGPLERWNAATGATTALTPTNSRFLAADDDLILWQGPLDFTDTGNGGFLHLLHLDTGKVDLIGLTRTDAASATISPDGRTIAVAAGPLAGRIGSVLLLEVGTTGLVGTPGPRVAVDGPAMTWSLDSRTLFWRTPDGELAVRHVRDGSTPLTEILRTGLADVTAVAAIGR